MRRGDLALLAALAVLAVGLDGFEVSFLTLAVVFGLFALSLDLIWGFGGVLFLGHGAFFGTGAYTAALLSDRSDVHELLIVVPVAAAITGIAAVLLGLFLFLGRAEPPIIYLALATLAIAFILERLAASTPSVGASSGMAGIGLPTLLGRELSPGLGIFFVAWFLLALTLLGFRWLTTRQLGLVMSAGRQDPLRCESLGFELVRAHALLFGLSGASAGVAGALLAVHEGFVGPGQLGVAVSTQVVLWVMVGGQRTLSGPIVAAVLLQYAQRYLSDQFPQQWPIMLAALLLVVVLWIPGGLGRVAAQAPEAITALRLRRAQAVRAQGEVGK